jgi:hypothetical protein
MTDANVSVSFSASIADFVSGVGDAKEALQSFSAPFGEISGQLNRLADAASRAFDANRLQPYRDALTATASLDRSYAADRGRAAASLRSGDDEAYADAVRAARLSTAEEIRILSDGLKQKLDLYAEEARFSEISQQQKLSLSRQALDEEYAAELAALQRQAGLGDQSLAAGQRIDNMMIEATRRRGDEITSLTRTALQQQQHDCQSFTDSIVQAFESQTRRLISGTTTWHMAFRHALEGLLIKFADWCETTAAHYALAEAMKTAATTSGVAARTAAEQGGATASLAAQGSAMLRSIFSSAAQTFAGVFGFLSPLMGPLAAGPAAAAQASVASMASAVASADIGIWRAPQDMLTLIHHNELIMPAAEAGAFRSLLSDGGAPASERASAVHIHPTTNFHVSALDAGSVSQWMRSNSAQMLRSIDEAVRHGSALGLKRLRTS